MLHQQVTRPEVHHRAGDFERLYPQRLSELFISKVARSSAADKRSTNTRWPLADEQLEDLVRQCRPISTVINPCENTTDVDILGPYAVALPRNGAQYVSKTVKMPSRKPPGESESFVGSTQDAGYIDVVSVRLETSVSKILHRLV